MNNLQEYLDYYKTFSPEILVVYRPTTDYWPRRGPERCLYKGEHYDNTIPYNHRTVHDNEIVIEFDDGTPEENKNNALIAALRLFDQRITSSVWCSGNKSTHVHAIIDLSQFTDKPLIKRLLVKHFTKGLAKPDLQLCDNNHLVRAEFGLHEKTGRYKTLLFESERYKAPLPAPVPHEFKDLYQHEKRAKLARKALKNGAYKTHPGVKALLNTHDFAKTVADGHQRGLYLLSNILKYDWKEREEEFVAFLQDWYSCSGGEKLPPNKVAATVKYQLRKDYAPFSLPKVEEILDDIGVVYIKEALS